MRFEFGRREFLRCLPAAAAPLVLPAWSRGDKNDPSTEVSATKDMITAEAQKAIDRGLKYLAEDQRGDGAWGNDRNYAGNVAVTALAGLAFMSGGHQPGRGPYGKNVERAIEYVLTRESREVPGFLYHQSGSSLGAMYGHGFGALFLAEAYGMVTKKDLQKRLRDTLERSVNMIVKSQNVEGGWRYEPRPSSADVSVTICQIMALRSARNAGLQVPKSCVEKCIKYVKDCQNSDGGFSYMRNSRNASAFARSAAGVSALYCAGIYEGKEIDSGLTYLMQSKPGSGRIPQFGRGNMGFDMHYYYGQYYAAQAMWTAGGKYWQEWFPAIREELLARSRTANGGIWTDNSVCNDYATAMALIILQIPNNYLPIMQK